MKIKKVRSRWVVGNRKFTTLLAAETYLSEITTEPKLDLQLNFEFPNSSENTEVLEWKKE